MKFRFSVEVYVPAMDDLPAGEEARSEDLQMFLEMCLEKGARSFGHTTKSAQFKVEKLRARSVDLDKPVGEQE